MYPSFAKPCMSSHKQLSILHHRFTKIIITISTIGCGIFALNYADEGKLGRDESRSIRNSFHRGLSKDASFVAEDVPLLSTVNTRENVSGVTVVTS